MATTTKTHTIDNLAIGTEIYYTGDMANQSGNGVIVAHRPANRWSGATVDIRLEDGREIKAIPPTMFDSSIGRRFWTMAEWQADRAEKIAAMKVEFERIVKGGR